MRTDHTLDAESRRAALMGRGYALPTLPLVLDHWLEIAGTSLLPCRDDVDPARIVKALPYITIHQIDGDGNSVFRLAGTRHFDMVGKEITDSNYLDYVAPERRDEARQRFRTVVGCPCGLYCRLQYLSPAGVERQAESLGLPLVGRSGEIDTILFVTEELPGPARWRDPNAPITHLEPLDVTYLDIGAGIAAP